MKKTLKNQIEESITISLKDNNLSKMSIESSKLTSLSLSNDYYFIDELKDTDYQYQYKNIKQSLNEQFKNKPTIFTVITPMGLQI